VLAVDPLAGLELPVPRLPRLRAVEPRWVRLGDELRLWLRDPLELSDRMALVPEVLLPLLAMLDGTHDARALAASFGLRTGIPLSTSTVETILRELDEALLLEGPRYERAVARLLAAYRALPHRPPALAGRSYPDDPDALDTLLEAFVAAWQEMVAAASTGTAGTPEAAPGALGPIARAAGVLSPHIDYGRGGLLYAGTWQAALAAVASAEVIVIFGTDHAGGPGRLTPTAQRYATPWGALEVDRAAVEAVAAALGEEAYTEELHHRSEHSIELAVIWLHWALRRAGRDPAGAPLVPLLCGSFQCWMGTEERPAGPPAAALAALARAIEGRRTLVVAAADLAHVGPAFGDAAPLSEEAKQALAAGDAGMLETIAAGDAEGFLAYLRAEGDRRRVCGLPPIYWAMRLLDRLGGQPARGRLVGYDQCPADERGGSVVSIAGMLWE